MDKISKKSIKKLTKKSIKKSSNEKITQVILLEKDKLSNMNILIFLTDKGRVLKTYMGNNETYHTKDITSFVFPDDL